MTLLVLVLMAALLALLLRFARPGDNQRMFGSPPLQEARWEQKILLLTRGNRAAMERALKNRQVKFPAATRLELLKLVHDEYLKDRE